MRYLVKCKVYKHGNQWTLNSDKGGTRVFNGSIEGFAKFLRKIQAKDDAVDPKTFRSMTYMNIAQEIADGGDNVIYVWSNMWPDNGKKTKVYSEDKNMRKIGEELLMKYRVIPDMNIDMRKYLKARGITGIVDIVHTLEKSVADVASEFGTKEWKEVIGELDEMIIIIEQWMDRKGIDIS